jgi:hypothetical protein
MLLKNIYLVSGSFLFGCLCFLATARWAAFYSNMMVPPCLRPKSNGVCWLWTEISETVSQNKSFLPYVVFSGILSQWQKVTNTLWHREINYTVIICFTFIICQALNLPKAGCITYLLLGSAQCLTHRCLSIWMSEQLNKNV